MINEHNIASSFRAVKGDIIKIESELMNLKEQQLHILEQLEKLNSKLKIVSAKPIKRKTSKKK